MRGKLNFARIWGYDRGLPEPKAPEPERRVRHLAKGEVEFLGRVYRRTRYGHLIRTDKPQ